MNRPKICCAIVNDDIDALKRIEPNVDLIEVRIDLIGDNWEEIAKKIEKPWIATNRTTREGGKWDGNEARRIEKLLYAIEIGAGMIDIEYRTKNLSNIVPLVKKRAECILSYHDTKETPSLNELKKIVKGQLEAGADICKVVTTAEKFEDNMNILRLIREFPENRIVAFAMGQAGQTSRVLSPLAGGYFTFGSAGEGKESAPGQITVKQLTNIYEMMEGE